jgi:hypothetical protein
MTQMADQGLATWSVDDVVSWLDSEGFSSEWKTIFTQNEIDGEALKLLKDPELLDRMGIPKPMGIRLKFWQRLENLSAGKGKARLPGFSSTTLSRPASDDNNDYTSPGAIVGTSTEAPMGTIGDQLVQEEKRFIDSVCELLAELEADDRDVTLLLDLKVISLTLSAESGR